MKIIEEYHQHWLNVGLDCTPIDHAKAEALIDELYVYTGLRPPLNKIWFPSPAAIVKKTGISASNFFCGLHNVYNNGYYTYCHDASSPNITDEKLYQIVTGITKHLHWYITGESHCFLSERPLYVSFKNKVLHADGKPAILYEDGFAIYSLNGVRVTKEIVETPADKLDPEIVLKETNAEVRREIVRKIGVERLEKKLKPLVLDRWGDYELHDYSNHFKRMRCRPVYLKMKNPSIGVWHYEGVNINEMETPTCQAALKWRLKGKDFKPIRIT